MRIVNVIPIFCLEKSKLTGLYRNPLFVLRKKIVSKTRITSNIRVAAHNISRRRANRVYRKASSARARTRCTVRSEAMFEVRTDDVLDLVCIPKSGKQNRRRSGSK